MACTLPCRKDLDGNKVLLIVPDDVNEDTIYVYANDLGRVWDGDPTELTKCCNADPISESVTLPQQVLSVEGCAPATFDINVRPLTRSRVGSYVVTSPTDTSDMASGVWQIPVPASAPGALLVLQLIGGLQDGSGDNGLGTFSISDPTSAADVGPQTALFTHGDINFDVDGHGWMFESPTGNAGGTIDVTLSGGPPPADVGVITAHWVELTASDGQPMLKSFVDVAASFNTELDTNTNDTWQLVDSGDFRSGGCGQLVMFHGRHTDHHVDAASGGGLPGEWDINWFNATAGTELWDWNSASANGQYRICQVGMAAAWIPPDTDFTVQVSVNQAKLRQVWGHHMEFMCERPCDDDVLLDETDQISLSFTPECDPFSGAKDISADLSLNVPAGMSVTVVPCVNGVEVTAQELLCDNTAGTAAATPTKNISFSQMLPTAAVGVEATCTAQVKLKLNSGVGEATATIDNFTGTVQE